jgi:hypothetical protein
MGITPDGFNEFLEHFFTFRGVIITEGYRRRIRKYPDCSSGY